MDWFILFIDRRISQLCSVQCNVSEDKDRASRDMDEYAKGVQVFHQAKKLDTLMEFLARYVRKVHADKFLKRKLIEEPGTGEYLLGPHQCKRHRICHLSGEE